MAIKGNRDSHDHRDQLDETTTAFPRLSLTTEPTVVALPDPRLLVGTEPTVVALPDPDLLAHARRTIESPAEAFATVGARAKALARAQMLDDGTIAGETQPFTMVTEQTTLMPQHRDTLREYRDASAWKAEHLRTQRAVRDAKNNDAKNDDARNDDARSPAQRSRVAELRRPPPRPTAHATHAISATVLPAPRLAVARPVAPQGSNSSPGSTLRGLGGKHDGTEVAPAPPAMPAVPVPPGDVHGVADWPPPLSIHGAPRPRGAPWSHVQHATPRSHQEVVVFSTIRGLGTPRPVIAPQPRPPHLIGADELQALVDDAQASVWNQPRLLSDHDAHHADQGNHWNNAAQRRLELRPAQLAAIEVDRRAALPRPGPRLVPRFLRIGVEFISALAAVLLIGLGQPELAPMLELLGWRITPSVIAVRPERAAHAAPTVTPIAPTVTPIAPTVTPIAPTVTPIVLTALPLSAMTPIRADAVALAITSKPSNATVILDGRRLGQTPLTVTQPAGQGTVVMKVRRRGYITRRFDIDLSQPVTLQVHLRPDEAVVSDPDAAPGPQGPASGSLDR